MRGHLHELMAVDQDRIVWHRFIDGMVCRCIRVKQYMYSTVEGSSISPPQWAKGLVIKLLEATHGQWLYQCIQIQDKVMGTRVTACKEDIQQEIERQLELGTEDLLDEDQYLAEMYLDYLESSSGGVRNTGYLLFVLCGRLAYSGDNIHQILVDRQQ